MNHRTLAKIGLSIFLATATVAPVFAQGAGQNSGGAKSDANECKTRLDQLSLATTQAKDATKRDAALKEIGMAKQSLANTDQIKCLEHADKANAALK